MPPTRLAQDIVQFARGFPPGTPTSIIQQATWNAYGKRASDIVSKDDDIDVGPQAGFFTDMTNYAKQNVQGFPQDFGPGSSEVDVDRLNAQAPNMFGGLTQPPDFGRQDMGGAFDVFGNLGQPFLRGIVPQLPGYFNPDQAAQNRLASFFGRPSAIAPGAEQFARGIQGFGGATPTQNLLTQGLQQAQTAGTEDMLQNILGGPDPQLPEVLPFLQRQLQQVQQNIQPTQEAFAQAPAGIPQFLGGSGQLLNQLIQQVPGTTATGLSGQASIEDLVRSQVPLGESQMRAAIGTLQGLGAEDPALQARREQLLTDPRQTQAPLDAQAARFQPPAPIATPEIQNVVDQQIRDLIAGGGLSPEFIGAQTRQVLDPARERLMGELNQQFGGQGVLTAGLPMEMKRRLERDFMDSLIRSGHSNLQAILGQGAALGGQQFGQGVSTEQMAQQAAQQQAAFEQQVNMANQAAAQRAGEFDINALIQQARVGSELGREELSRGLGVAGQQAELGRAGIAAGLEGFGAVPQAVLPALQQQMQLQQALEDQALNRYTTMGTQGLNMLNQIAQLGQQPFNLAQAARTGNLAALDPLQQREQYLGNLYNQDIQNAMNFLQGQQAFGTRQSEVAGDILRSALSGEYEKERAGQEARGGLIGSLIGATPDIYKIIKPPKTGLLSGLGQVAGGVLGGYLGGRNAEPSWQQLGNQPQMSTLGTAYDRTFAGVPNIENLGMMGLGPLAGQQARTPLGGNPIAGGASNLYGAGLNVPRLGGQDYMGNWQS